MRVKATLFVVLLAFLVIDDSEALDWASLIHHGVKAATSLSSLWDGHSWERSHSSHRINFLRDMEKVREMDDENYKAFMNQLEQDIADEFNDDQARDFFTGLDEMRKLSDDEFKIMREMSNDIGQDEKTGENEAKALNQFIRRLSRQEDEE